MDSFGNFESEFIDDYPCDRTVMEHTYKESGNVYTTYEKDSYITLYKGKHINIDSTDESLRLYDDEEEKECEDSDEDFGWIRTIHFMNEYERQEK